jgi:hypothetical protein
MKQTPFSRDAAKMIVVINRTSRCFLGPPFSRLPCIVYTLMIKFVLTWHACFLAAWNNKRDTNLSIYADIRLYRYKHLKLLVFKKFRPRSSTSVFVLSRNDNWIQTILLFRVVGCSLQKFGSVMRTPSCLALRLFVHCTGTLDVPGTRYILPPASLPAARYSCSTGTIINS